MIPDNGIREYILTSKLITSTDNPIAPQPIARPASEYSDKQLADIYNQARVDYIVPMPMNGKRMREYIDNYDIDLDLSIVAINPQGIEAGIGMLGVRGNRSWITRLGVVPNNRGLHLGQFLMDELIQKSIEIGITSIQLEVIVGNEPALRLFQKLGFEETRELVIVRRPPSEFVEVERFESATAIVMDQHDISFYLEQREAGASWVEETPSLLNGGKLNGITVTLTDGREGWIVFQRSPFQLSHIVFCDTQDVTLLQTLLYQVHKSYPMQDTKVENVPSTHHTWAAFQAFGYLEVFRRTEMVLNLK